MSDEEISISVVTDADTSSLDALEELMDRLEEKATELGMEISNSLSDTDVDSSSIDGVSESAEEASGSLDDMADSADGASSSVGGISGDGIDGVTETANSATDSYDKLATTAMGAASALGMSTMADTAGRISDSWNRLGLTFGGVTAKLKSDVTSASNATGRSGATVRGYFNTMGVAGVTNTSLLSKSFQSLSGRSYQTGVDIGTMEASLQRMVLSGKTGARQLTKLGINTTELGKAMGVSGDQAADAFEKLSQEERLEVLTKAMGDGTQANDEYANSWEGVKSKNEAALAGLMGKLGSCMNQTLIPVMKSGTTVVNGLADGIDGLPGPFKTVIGAVAGAGFSFVTLLGSMQGILSGLSGLRQSLLLVKDATKVLTMENLKNTISEIRNGVVKVINTARTIAQTIAEKASLIVKRLLNSTVVTTIINLVREAVARIISIARKIAETAVDIALAIAEYLLASPILLVVIAVIAAIAVMLYLYNTNTQVKATVDWLIASFWSFLTTVYTVFIGALSYIVNFASSVGAWLLNAWNGFLIFLGYLAGFPARLWAYLSSAIQRVISFGNSFISNLRSSASRGVSSFISGIVTLGTRVYSELQGTLNKVIEWGSQIVSKFSSIAQQAWSAFVNGLGIGSPGYIAINTQQELQRVSDHADAYGGTFKSKFEALGSLASDSYLKGNGMVTNLPTGTGQSVTGGNTININIEGNVKDDATVDKIANAVTKALSWNNTLAGRTIGDTVE